LTDVIGVAEALLEEILQTLNPDEGILILLDEVDPLGSEKGRLLGQLRAIITSPELTQIAWILTGRRPLQTSIEGPESPLINVLAPILLKNLDVIEARRLVEEPARREKIYIEPDAVATILRQTGCQPFMLNVICSTLVNQLKDRRAIYVSQNLVEEIIAHLLD